MRKCPFCYKTVGNDPHIYGCKIRTTNDKIEIKYLFISENFPFLSNKDNIVDRYVKNNNSLTDIRKEFGIDFKSIMFLLDYFKISKRSISESALIISNIKYKKTCMERYGVDNVSKSKDIKEKKKKTFLENYGVDNIWKSEEFKVFSIENRHLWVISPEKEKERSEKQKISFKKFMDSMTPEEYKKYFDRTDAYKNWKDKLSDEEYKSHNKSLGIISKKWWDGLSDDEYKKICEYRKNVWINKNDEYKKEWGERTSSIWKNKTSEEKLKIKEKYKTSISKYWSNIPIGDIRRMSISNSYKKFIDELSDEQKSAWFLRSCFISKLESRFQEVLNSLNIKYQNQFFVNRKSYDFKILDTMILIEIQGDFWHANPKIYESNDIINHPGKKIKANEIWIKDHKKKENANKYGYKVIYFWEDEMNSMNDIDLSNLILDRIFN